MALFGGAAAVAGKVGNIRKGATFISGGGSAGGRTVLDRLLQIPYEIAGQIDDSYINNVRQHLGNGTGGSISMGQAVKNSFKGANGRGTGAGYGYGDGRDGERDKDGRENNNSHGEGSSGGYYDDDGSINGANGRSGKRLGNGAMTAFMRDMDKKEDEELDTLKHDEGAIDLSTGQRQISEKRLALSNVNYKALAKHLNNGDYDGFARELARNEAGYNLALNGAYQGDLTKAGLDDKMIGTNPYTNHAYVDMTPAMNAVKAGNGANATQAQKAKAKPVNQAFGAGARAYYDALERAKANKASHQLDAYDLASIASAYPSHRVTPMTTAIGNGLKATNKHLGTSNVQSGRSFAQQNALTNVRYKLSRKNLVDKFNHMRQNLTKPTQQEMLKQSSLNAKQLTPREKSRYQNEVNVALRPFTTTQMAHKKPTMIINNRQLNRLSGASQQAASAMRKTMRTGKSINDMKVIKR